MATIRKFEMRDAERLSKQTEAAASILLSELDGEKFIQLDSYGSPDRQLVGKRSQSMRLTREAFEQLVKLGTAHFKGE